MKTLGLWLLLAGGLFGQSQKDSSAVGQSKYVWPPSTGVKAGIPRCQQKDQVGGLCNDLSPKLTSWKWSVVGLAWATSLDIASSRGLEETNPILGRGPFGARQAGIKVGLVGSAVLTEWLWLRKHPQHEKVFTYVNVGATGVTVGVAIRNWRLR